MSDESLVQPQPNLLDRANHRADQMLQSTSVVAQQTLDDLARTANGLKADAGKLGQRGLDALHDSGQQLRDSARHAGERTRDYIRDEPVKAVLVAAATGAVLMALISLLNRPHGHR